MSATIPAKCPNCAWAIQTAEERGLGMAEGWILVHVAEWVSRRTFEWSSTITGLAQRLRLSRRGVQMALKRIPDDLLTMRLQGKQYTFTIHRTAHDVRTSAANDDPQSAHEVRSDGQASAHEVRATAHDVHTTAHDVRTAHNIEEESPKDSPSSPKTSRVRARETREAEGWQEFREHYPRKEDPGRAFKAYLRAVKAAGDYNDVLDALEVAKEEDRRFLGDPQYIPHPTTWLNAGPWHAPKSKPNGAANGEAAHAS